MRKLRLACAVFPLALEMLAVACRDDGLSRPSAGPVAVNYRGTFGGGDQSGTLQVRMVAASGALVGTLNLGTAVHVPLTGAGDVVSRTFTASGGGYTLTGGPAPGGISGIYTGPSGDGVFVLGSTALGTVELFCGTLTGGDTGSWNLAATYGGAALGVSANGAVAAVFDGTWGKGGAVTLAGPLLSGTGSLSVGLGGSGAWSSTSGPTGAWAVTVCPDPPDLDAGTSPAGPVDAGPDFGDASLPFFDANDEAAEPDAEPEAAPPDASPEGGVDGGGDAEPGDAAPPDADAEAEAPPDAEPPVDAPIDAPIDAPADAGSAGDGTVADGAGDTNPAPSP